MGSGKEEGTTPSSSSPWGPSFTTAHHDDLNDMSLHIMEEFEGEKIALVVGACLITVGRLLCQETLEPSQDIAFANEAFDWASLYMAPIRGGKN